MIAATIPRGKASKAAITRFKAGITLLGATENSYTIPPFLTTA